MISKILANRLKNVLNLCISKNQAAFVPGRQILDNVIFSHEFLHHLKNKRQGNAGLVALKLDMSKAYDRMEWRFLEAIMEKMDFCNKWIKWIMSCITTVTYSFNINGDHRGLVTPQKGIRQGDHLSPYLFLLCSEGLSNLLKRAEDGKKITRMTISRRGPSISHLFFADDSLIFCKAESSQAKELMYLLKRYEEGSGQMINLEKSSVFFSKNMSNAKQDDICKKLGKIQKVSQGKYLGLPIVVTRTKEQVFVFVKDNCQKRINSWKNKFLSAAGKEKKLAQEKENGGLDFKDLQRFNRALLGKQSIMGAREEVEEGIRRKIGNGRSTKVWDNQWIPETPRGQPTTVRPQNCNISTVDQLISNFRWNRPVVFSTFNSEDAGKILKIPISWTGKEDSNFWIHSGSRQYIVRSVYKEMTNKEVQDTSSRGSLDNPSGSLGGRMGWKHLWNLNVKQKIKVFIWKCMNNALPVRELIYDRTKLGEPICTGCGEGEETVEHLLFHCKNAEQVWNISPVQWEGAADQRGCFRRWWSALLGTRARQGGLEHICLTANSLWHLWKARNERVFKEKNKLPLQVIQKVMQEWMEHREAMEGIRKESIAETFDAVDESEHNTVEGEGIDVQVAITIKKERQVVGIGVMANDTNGQEKAIGL
nr:uncharacterized protein LOC113693433 [Coffea arabica]